MDGDGVGVLLLLYYIRHDEAGPFFWPAARDRTQPPES
jgi:hypothetical protein